MRTSKKANAWEGWRFRERERDCDRGSLPHTRGHGQMFALSRIPPCKESFTSDAALPVDRSIHPCARAHTQIILLCIQLSFCLLACSIVVLWLGGQKQLTYVSDCAGSTRFLFIVKTGFCECSGRRWTLSMWAFWGFNKVYQLPPCEGKKLHELRHPACSKSDVVISKGRMAQKHLHL